MIPYELQQVQGVRENRYGIHGDNGYNEIVEAQRRKDGLDFYNGMSDDNILDFKQSSPEYQEDDEAQDLDDSYDRKPVKEENNKRKIDNRPVQGEPLI